MIEEFDDYDGAYEIGFEDNDDYIIPFDVGWTAAIGLQYKKLRFDVSHDWGWIDVMTFSRYHSLEMQNMASKISLTYMFGIS